MSHEAFSELVGRLEALSERSPRAYRARVLLLAGLGYAYIGSVLLALAALLGGLVWLATLGKGLAVLLEAGAALLSLTVIVARSLWVKLGEPQGVPVERERFPMLFAAIDELRRELRAPRVHRVLVTDEFNAAMAQRPRLGLLGWQRNYLILGLPFLQSCSPEEARAVIAHELGHLSGAHNKLNAWVYRVRESWQRIDERLSREKHWGQLLFRRFFHWYAPCFAAWSFVLARQNEYEADAASASLTSPEAAADALCGVNVRGRFVDARFWPKLFAAADDLPSPEANPYEELPRALAAMEADEARGFLAEALARKTDLTNTHPCLRDRLAALDCEPRVPPVPERSAAEALLGKALPGLSARMGEMWRFAVAEWWRERHEHVGELRKELGELESRSGRAPLPFEDAWQRARLTEELHGSERALPLYEELVEEDLEDPRPRYALGRLLLDRGQEAGLYQLDRAMELSEDAVLPACERAHAYLVSRQREKEAAAYAERWNARRAWLEANHAERSGLPVDGSVRDSRILDG